ncbi:MAG: ANTAR domain-containing response regulator [Candidatus Nanopelagicales bacterium]
MTQAALRIVVAEDEAVIRMDLVETLREEGYEVVAEASDGVSAVDAIRSRRPDVALVDIAMPALDGIEVTRQVSDEAAVVVVTAFGQRERIGQAREAGAMAYLVKPVTRDDLIPAIEMAWSGWITLKDLRGQVVASEAAAERAEQRLAERRQVERAKGILGESLGMSEDAAYRWLRQAAMDARRSLADVAQEVIDSSGGNASPK